METDDDYYILTPPEESYAEDEEELDLPIFGATSPNAKGALNTLPNAPATIATVENKSESPQTTPSCLSPAHHRRSLQISSDFENLQKLSPLKEGKKDAPKSNTKKIALKVKKLSKTLKERTELEKKLEKFRAKKGIQGIAKEKEKEEEKILAAQLSRTTSLNRTNSGIPTPNQSLSIAEGSLSSVGELLRLTSNSDDTLPSALPLNPPGKQIFIHKPSLLTEISPPEIEEDEGGTLKDFLTNQREGDLKNALCGDVLPLCFLTKPCPPGLQKWMFHLLGCSQESSLSARVLKSAIALMRSAVTNHQMDMGGGANELSKGSCISVDDVLDVLIKLGADQSKLLPTLSHVTTSEMNDTTTTPISDTTTVTSDVVTPGEIWGDEVFTHPQPPSINLVHITSYLSACLQYLPGCFTVQDLENLVLILCNLSLDQFCRQFLQNNLQHCLGLLLAAYPDSVWSKAVQRLVPQLLVISQHHDDRLHLAYFICRHTPRQLQLMRAFCRVCLEEAVKCVSGEGGRSASSDGVRRMGSGDGEGVRSGGGDVESVRRGSGDGEGGKTGDGNGESEGDCKIMDVKNSDEEQGIKKGDKNNVEEKSDKHLWTEVMQTYNKASLRTYSYEDYYRMHSILHMLQLCCPLSEITWSGEKEKATVHGLLISVCSEVRNELRWPCRAPVKDLLVMMRVEMGSFNSRGRQRDLFSFCTT